MTDEERALALAMRERLSLRKKSRVSYKNNGAGESGGINHELDHSEKESDSHPGKKQEEPPEKAAAAALLLLLLLPLPLSPPADPKQPPWSGYSAPGVTSGEELMPGVDSDSLPEVWICKMNYWDTARANCAVPQESEQPVSSPRGRRDGPLDLFSGPRPHTKR